MDRGATFDESGKYRYELTRRWGEGVRVCCFVMLNPSTADAFEEDPTIRRCISFAASWSYHALVVVNLFALRATDPSELKASRDPIGERNTGYMFRAAVRAPEIICAWGAHGDLLGRAGHVHHDPSSTSCVV